MVHISTEQVAPPSSQSSDVETSIPAHVPMDQTLKAKWVAALRSGSYRQTTGCLRRGDAYCCLGVLCDISGAGQWQLNGAYEFVIDDDNSHSGYLPMPLTEQANLHGVEYKLTEMNDEDKLSFTEIADYIEKNL